MNLLINGEKLEFSLENENKLSDVIAHLNQWIVSGKHFIESCLVNGQEMDVEKALASDVPVTAIKSIEITTKGHLDQIEEVVPVIKNYISRFIEEIQKGKEIFCINKREKIEGLIWILDSITLVATNLNIQQRHVFFAGKNLEEMLGFMKVSVNTLMQGIHDSEFFYSYFKEGILSRLPLLEKMLDLSLSYYNFLVGSKNQDFTEIFFNESAEISAVLKNIPLLLQDGKDQEALTMIQKSMCYFEALNITLDKLKLTESERRDSMNLKQEIMDLFNQCYESFKIQDIVSVSDIIEYEIDEKIKALAGFLKADCAVS